MLKPHDSLPRVLLPERQLLDKIWGGRVLAERLALEAPRLGETWDCYDRGPASSAGFRNLAGVTLHELCRDRRDELLGEAQLDDFGRFPLMLKLLDATQRLSLQVHPDDEQARGMQIGDTGKTEAWVVLQARESAALVCGYRGEAAELCDAFLRADFNEDLLELRAARAGDVVAIPPGTVHAVGAGYVLYEIQQNSDVTLRLHDWGRVGDDGKPRELHHDAGRVAIDRAATKSAPIVEPERESELCERLVANERFELRRVRVEREVELDPGAGFALVTPTEDAVELDDVTLQELETGLVRGRVGPMRLAPVGASATLLVASAAGLQAPSFS